MEHKLTAKIPVARAQYVTVTEDALAVDLADGRTIVAPLVWYLRLLHGILKERNNWRLIGGGEGIHWPDLDEDIRVENILAGKPSGESQRSLKRWLEGRTTRNRQKVRNPSRDGQSHKGRIR